MKSKLCWLLLLLSSCAWGQKDGYNFPTTGVGLTVYLSAGSTTITGTVTTYAGGYLTMTKNATSNVYIDSGTGQPTISTSAFPSGSVPLFTATTDNFSVLSIVDKRVTYALGSGSVSSVFTRTGAVVAASGDYSFSLISGTVTNAQLANSYSGIGSLSCANQVPTSITLNANAAPSGFGCATITNAYTSGTFSATAHNLLSATHGDTTPASVVLGDLIVGQTGPVWARLAGNTTSTKQFLTQTGTGSVSANPAWGTIASGDLPSGTVTGSGLTANNMLAGGGSSAIKLADGNGVAYAEGTITTSNPFISHTATFNAGGVVFHNFVSNVTNTASAAGSMLMELQKAATNQFSVDLNGNAQALTSLQTTATPPGCTAGTAGAWCASEGTAFTNVSGASGLDADSTIHEWISKNNGSANAGIMLRVQPGYIKQTAKTASILTATLCAAAAGACNVAGQYEVHFNFIEDGTACSSVVAGSVAFNLTWKDANGTTHSAVQLGMDDASAINSVSQLFHFATSLANAWASGQFTFDSDGSTDIQYSTTYTACTTGTGSYQLRASVTHLQS